MTFATLISVVLIILDNRISISICTTTISGSLCHFKLESLHYYKNHLDFHYTPKTKILVLNFDLMSTYCKKCGSILDILVYIFRNCFLFEKLLSLPLKSLLYFHLNCTLHEFEWEFQRHRLLPRKTMNTISWMNFLFNYNLVYSGLT